MQFVQKGVVSGEVGMARKIFPRTSTRIFLSTPYDKILATHLYSAQLKRSDVLSYIVLKAGSLCEFFVYFFHKAIM